MPVPRFMGPTMAKLCGRQHGRTEVINVNPVANLCAVAPDDERVAAVDCTIDEARERGVQGLIGAIPRERPDYENVKSGVPGMPC